MMCHTYANYNLCGHLHSTTTTSCTPKIHARIGTAPRASSTQRNKHKFPIRRPPAQCFDIPRTTEVLPTLCKFCLEKGEVSAYLRQNPGAEVDVLRSWKASLRLEKVKTKAEAAAAMGGASDAGSWVGSGDEEKENKEGEWRQEAREKTSGAESLEFIGLSELRSEASASESASAPSSDSLATCLKSANSSASTRSSMLEEEVEDTVVMRAAIAALRARVVETLSTITC